MKIVSNFKDYYDYVIGVYGIDPKAVYERICETEIEVKRKKEWVKSGLYKPIHLTTNTRVASYMIGFCGTIYCIYWMDGKFYFGREYYGIARQFSGLAQSQKYRDWVYPQYHLTKTNVNDLFNCPVVVMRGHLWRQDSYNIHQKWWAQVKNPRLSDFGFASKIPANTCFMELTNFLLKEKEIVDNRTDKEKIVSKGFDLKSSFRNVK